MQLKNQSPLIVDRWKEKGLGKGEELVAYYKPSGGIGIDVMIPDGQFPSEKACEISRALNNNK